MKCERSVRNASGDDDSLKNARLKKHSDYILLMDISQTDRSMSHGAANTFFLYSFSTSVFDASLYSHTNIVSGIYLQTAILNSHLYITL